MGLRIRRYVVSSIFTNCYLVWCEETGEGAIVDPGEFTDEIREDITRFGVDVKAVYLTHGHWDHNGGVENVLAETDATVYAAGDYPGGVKVGNEDILQLGGGNITFRAVSTPGHTDDSICLITDGCAFVGDALFAAAVGGTSGRNRFEQEIEGVARHILTLPADTVLYTGHGPATTVAVERCYNPFFI